MVWMGPVAGAAAAVAHIIGDGDVVTFMEIERPVALDIVEHFLSPGVDERPLRQYRRTLAVRAIRSGDWSVLARDLGVPEEEINCFISEAWGDERDTLLRGIADVLMIYQTETMKFVPAVGDTGVSVKMQEDGSVAVTLSSPIRN